MNHARRRAVRAILSALAGGGITATGVAAALPASAVAGGSGSAGGGAETGASSQEAASGESSTGTTTTTPPPSAAPTETTATTTVVTTPEASTTPTATVPASTTPSTETTATTPSEPAPEAPKVVLKSKQQASPGSAAGANATTTPPGGAGAKPKKKRAAGKSKASGRNGVAASPQAIAAEAGALAAILASSEASDQALAFYRIPLFLLPIYKAAAVQYGVPWQILAAINEIETDYGSDQSVSTAGAVGWMQFMPSTWLQYGVDALNAGYADPYNPVDAVFAAARYLRAAGAATNLRAAIFAYNHSDEYVESVLLRAKLISSYPKAVIATLTGLVDGRLPVTGRRLSWQPLDAGAASAPSSNATAAASALAPGAAASAAAPATGAASEAAGAATEATGSSSTPGSTAAPAPSAAAAAATARKRAHARPLQMVELLSSPNAAVVAVQDGRVVRIGHSRKLGRYVVLRDVYGDVFTYAGFGSVASSYSLPKAPGSRLRSAAVQAASTHGPAPSQPASAGTQPPVTLHVKTPASQPADGGRISLRESSEEGPPAGMGRPRLFAHPGNPDARAAKAAAAARRRRRSSAGHRLPLRAGAVVASGTVLGRVSVPPGARDGHLRFAVRPAGDTETVNAGPILSNWAQLQTALHPRGAKAADALLGATASDVLLLSKAQLERAVLADPGVKLDACARREVAAGAVDRRVLAVLEFLSRSGLQPTVSALRCTRRSDALAASPAGALSGEEADISAINGTPIAGHQGAESITELTIRTLLALPKEFVPHEIASLMSFPGAASTRAAARDWNRIHIAFRAPARRSTLAPSAAARVAHSARAGRTAPLPVVSTSPLDAAQWSQLMVRVGAIPEPALRDKPSSAAVPDPTRPRRRSAG
ncbi:MAG TPA: lytic murein transglycosylase [Solirubrobacteraceae bacterium]|nr:lytic murein transglycosylase [Solirubrobacteraceae bacterium]